jgi:anthranilate phosphoribosyltransferase
VLAGRGAAARDAVLLNAAAAIAVFDGVSASSLSTTINSGLQAARLSIDSGAAADVLERWIVSSQHARPTGS